MQPALEGVAGLVLWGAVFYVMIRLGLPAALSTWLHAGVYAFVPTTFDPSSWYAGRALFGVGLMFLIAASAWWVSRAGRPLMRDAILP